MLSDPINKLILELNKKTLEKKESSNGSEPVIEIGQFVSTAGVWYEKIRYAIDYKDEHLLRRNAIERILKRKLQFDTSGGQIARALIVELILAGYLPNAAIPESAAEQIQNLINKYLMLASSILNNTSYAQQSYFKKRILTILAGSIEDFLFSNFVGELTLDAMYQTVRPLVVINDNTEPQNLIDDVVYMACAKALFGNDEAGLFFNLWRYHSKRQPDYNLDEIDIAAERFIFLCSNIEQALSNKNSWRLAGKLKNYATYFSLIREIAADRDVSTLEEFLSEPSNIAAEVSKRLENKYAERVKRTKQSAIRAFWYILLTKVVLAFVVELPYDKVVLHHVHIFPLLINVVFPPLLLFVMTRRLPVAGPENVVTAVAGVEQVVFGHQAKTIEIRTRNFGWLWVTMWALYALIAWLVFWLIYKMLHALNFNIVSGALFFFFLTLVSFFGLRVRYTAKKFFVAEKKETTRVFILNSLTLPIVGAGQWLSKRFTSINVFIFIMDILIETPFKLLLRTVDAFASYLREKREELY